jgi:hypothetical protein
LIDSILKKIRRHLRPKMRTKKRTLLATKVYGFNPWMDQVTAINQMMETAGQKSEAPILRDLIDEALIARRRKSAGIEMQAQTPPAPEVAETLETIQTLLLRIIGQGEIAFRIGSITLELSQEILVEARAGRMSLWEALVVPALREKGKSAQEVARLLEAHVDEGKDFSYGLAEEIGNELKSTETKTSSAAANKEDRQTPLAYEDSDTLEFGDADVA